MEFLEPDAVNTLWEHLRRIRSRSTFGHEYIKSSLLEPHETGFVIASFKDPEIDTAYEQVIKPILKKAGLRCVRIDQEHVSNHVMHKVLREISRARVVIADMTHERQNCYYEAGFAHALGKNVILTVKKGARIHFDLNGAQFLVWESEAKLGELLTSALAGLTDT